MNVLLTCAGRRNYLVRYFREALQGRGRVLAADASPNAPALQEADGWFTLPPVCEPGYVGELLERCRTQGVRLLVSLNDLELPVLAHERERFQQAGVLVAVSSPDVVERCFDKWEMARSLTAGNVPVPRTFPLLEESLAACCRGDASFPLVVKPRWGTASIGIHYVANPAELDLAYRFACQQVRQSIIAKVGGENSGGTVIVQERLEGEEYGLDIVNDLEGRHVTTLVRRKLAMRAGETDRAVTCHDKELESLGRQIGRLLGHVGSLDCDVIRGPRAIGVIDMNPRFGGGYPFVHMAGANLPAALVAWAEGREVDPAWFQYRAGVTSCKYDSLLTVPAVHPHAS